MAYKTKDIEKELLKVIRERKIVFISHAIAYTSFNLATLYNHELEKLESIKTALAKNRATGKNYLIQKWIGSDNATLQIAAFRLMSTPEEHKKLNQQYIDHTTDGEKFIFKPIDLDVEE